jgi:CubicO group peptidase (beta-lactamase class C family)
MHDDTIFRFYSMTKPITVVAVLQLYEEGKFLLTDPVARYLPEFADMQVYVDANTMRPASAPITIEDLLTHTAGLSYNDDTVDGVPKLYAEADLWTVATLDEFTKRVASLPLVFDPGTHWHYSVATDVLGRLVEVASEQPFEEYLQQRVLGPLKMSDTAFFVPDSKIDRFTPLYRRDGEGMALAETVEESRYRDTNRVPFGGSGLVSTANDYLRFMQMLLNDGELDGARILGRKTVDLMMLDHLGPDIQIPREPDAWLANTENRSGDLNLGLGHGYGGYVIVDVAENDVPGTVGTYSWGGAASTYFFVDRKEQLAAIFLTQLIPSSSYPIRAQFRGLVYQAIVD